MGDAAAGSADAAAADEEAKEETETGRDAAAEAQKLKKEEAHRWRTNTKAFFATGKLLAQCYKASNLLGRWPVLT